MGRMGLDRAAATLRAGVLASAVVFATTAVGARSAAAQVTQSTQSWGGVLSGAQQAPGNASTGSGSTLLTLSGNLLTVNLSWTGLVGGPVTGAHIHCCIAPGNNTDVAVPFTGIAFTTAGTYTNIFDLTNASIYTSAYLAASGGTAAGAEARLIGGLNAGQAYVNVHNTTYPGGEIRANVSVVATPEPATFALAAVGLGGAGLAARRRRRA